MKPAILIAAFALALPWPASAGFDADITLELYRMDQGVNWTRHDERCVMTKYTDCHHADGGKGQPCKNGDTIHIDFAMGDCNDQHPGHIKFAFTDPVNGTAICTVEATCYPQAGCQLTLTSGVAAGYECGGGNEAGVPTIRISDTE